MGRVPARSGAWAAPCRAQAGAGRRACPCAHAGLPASEARAIRTEEVEEGASLEDYQMPGSYGEKLREALEEEREEDQQEEEGAGDSLEKDELSNTKK